MIYKLQSASYGDDWQDERGYPRDSSDLEQWIKLGKRQETHGGKYHYRIIDENNVVVWTRTPPYEGVHIDLAQSGELWLDAIRQDYGLDIATFRDACKLWLDTHTE